MRLVLQGFREPAAWDVESNESPVAQLSTIRTLVFAAGSGDLEADILSSVDVSVAFLQSTSDTYGPEEPAYQGSS